MERVVFIVLHYRGEENTAECVQSLCRMELPKKTIVDIVVVDNNSPDPYHLPNTKCAIGDLTVIKNPANLGYSGGMNTGILFAFAKNADYVIVLNNDTVIDKHFLQVIIHRFRKDDKLMIIAPKILFFKGTEFHAGRYKDSERGKVIWYAGGLIDWKNVYGFHRGVDEVDRNQYASGKTIFASGCCIAFRTDVLREVGIFDDAYYLYYEDIDLSMRLRRAGYSIFFEPEAILWHKNAKSAGGPGSPLQDYFITRNRLIFGMKYAPLRIKVSLLKESLGLILTGRKWQRRGVIDFFLHRFGKGSYPVRP
jgi:GT2 family glycosyltransferase